jgi:hypothetical protein
MELRISVIARLTGRSSNRLRWEPSSRLRDAPLSRGMTRIRATCLRSMRCRRIGRVTSLCRRDNASIARSTSAPPTRRSYGVHATMARAIVRNAWVCWTAASARWGIVPNPAGDRVGHGRAAAGQIGGQGCHRAPPDMHRETTGSLSATFLAQPLTRPALSRSKRGVSIAGMPSFEGRPPDLISENATVCLEKSVTAIPNAKPEDQPHFERHEILATFDAPALPPVRVADHASNTERRAARSGLEASKAIGLDCA